MGKSGISSSVQKGELAIAQEEMANSQKLFNTSYPGFQEAENYYQQLASGDPTAISRAIAPATEQITAQTQATKERISQDMPRGGAKSLALEENEINKGAQIGKAATQGYLSSFQNLAGLAGQGIGEASTYSGQAGSEYSSIAGQQEEGKASQLGFISSLAGSATSAVAACWIAVALWGEGDLRTITVRYYLGVYAQYHWLGRFPYALYKRFGERVAEYVKRYRLLRWTFMPLFNWIYDHAGKVLSEVDRREINNRHEIALGVRQSNGS